MFKTRTHWFGGIKAKVRLKKNEHTVQCLTLLVANHCLNWCHFGVFASSQDAFLVSSRTTPSVNKLGSSTSVLFCSQSDRNKYIENTVKLYKTTADFALTDSFSWVTDTLLSRSQRWLAEPNISYSLLMKSWIKPSLLSLIPRTQTHTNTHKVWTRKHRRPLSRTPAVPAEDYPRKTLLLLGRSQITFQSTHAFFIAVHVTVCMCWCVFVWACMHAMSVQT